MLTAIAAALLRHVRASDVVAGVGKVTSRNDVRRELVFDEGDSIAQLQLAFLQTLDLDDVGARRFLQRGNRGIQVAMLLQEARKLRPKLAFFLFRHFRLGRALVLATLRMEHRFKSIS